MEAINKSAVNFSLSIEQKEKGLSG